MDEVKAYCMKCKTERVVQDAHVVTTKNGRRAAQGTCPVCGTKMFKFLPKLTTPETAETVAAAAPAEPKLTTPETTETVAAAVPTETAPAAPPTEPAPMG